MNEMWYALVQDEQLGPLSFNEVIDFYYKDIITAETLLWRDGLSGWSAISQLQEFKDLLFQGDLLPSPVNGPVGGDTRIFEPEPPPVEGQAADESPLLNAPPAHQLPEPSVFSEVDEVDELDEVEGDALTPPSPPTPPPSAPPALPPVFTPPSALTTSTDQEETELLKTPLPPMHSPLPPELMGERASLDTAERRASTPSSPPLALDVPLEATPSMSSARSNIDEGAQQAPAAQVIGIQPKPKARSRGPLISVLALTALMGGGYWLGELSTPPETPNTQPAALPLPTPLPPQTPLNVNNTSAQPQTSAVEAERSVQVDREGAPPSAGREESGLGGSPSALTAGDEPLPLPESPSTQDAGEELVLGPIDLSGGVEGGAEGGGEVSAQGEPSSNDKTKAKRASTKKPESAAQRNARLLAQKRARAERQRRQEAARVAAAKRKRAQRQKELPLNLSRQAINKELKRVTPRLKACASGDPELKGSTVVVSTQIAVSGKVASAKANTRRLVNSPQRECVLNVVRAMRFPPFQREMPPIPLPLKL